MPTWGVFVQTSRGNQNRQSCRAQACGHLKYGPSAGGAGYDTWLPFLESVRWRLQAAPRRFGKARTRARHSPCAPGRATRPSAGVRVGAFGRGECRAHHLRHRAGEERGQGQVRKLRAFAPDVCAWLGRSCQAKCDRLERPGRSLTDDSRAEAQRAGERCPHERRARARVRPFRAGNGAPAWSSLQTTRQMPASCSVDRSAARQPPWRVSRCERAVRSGE